MSWNFSVLYKKEKQLTRLNNQAGFGLVELMVSISIIVIVAGIILTRQSTFNSAVLLRGQAYEVALRAREVQLNAVSAGYDGADFRSVLGIHFDTTVGKEGKYVVFRDTPTGGNSNGFFDTGEEFDIQGMLDVRFEVREIRVGGSVEQDLSVIFVRPNFDARFFVGPSGASDEADVSLVEIDIARRGAVGTGDDVLRTVEITSTGQIGVK